MTSDPTSNNAENMERNLAQNTASFLYRRECLNNNSSGSDGQLPTTTRGPGEECITQNQQPQQQHCHWNSICNAYSGVCECPPGMETVQGTCVVAQQPRGNNCLHSGQCNTQSYCDNGYCLCKAAVIRRQTTADNGNNICLPHPTDRTDNPASGTRRENNGLESPWKFAFNKKQNTVVLTTNGNEVIDDSDLGDDEEDWKNAEAATAAGNSNALANSGGGGQQQQQWRPQGIGGQQFGSIGWFEMTPPQQTQGNIVQWGSSIQNLGAGRAWQPSMMWKGSGRMQPKQLTQQQQSYYEQRQRQSFNDFNDAAQNNYGQQSYGSSTSAGGRFGWLNPPNNVEQTNFLPSFVTGRRPFNRANIQPQSSSPMPESGAVNSVITDDTTQDPLANFPTFAENEQQKSTVNGQADGSTQSEEEKPGVTTAGESAMPGEYCNKDRICLGNSYCTFGWCQCPDGRRIDDKSGNCESSGGGDDGATNGTAEPQEAGGFFPGQQHQLQHSPTKRMGASERRRRPNESCGGDDSNRCVDGAICVRSNASKLVRRLGPYCQCSSGRMNVNGDCVPKPDDVVLLSVGEQCTDKRNNICDSGAHCGSDRICVCENDSEFIYQDAGGGICARFSKPGKQHDQFL